MIALRSLIVNSKATFILFHRYSTATAVVKTPAAPISPRPHFITDYLINSLGFSEEEAFTTSAKVNHLKPNINPNLIINLFKECGLNQTQIKNIIYKQPSFLACRVNETLESKFRVFQELGLHGSDLFVLIINHSNIFRRGLNTHILPTINFLRNVLSSDENVVKAITKSRWILSPGSLKRMSENVNLLKNYGFSDEKIKRFVLRSTGEIAYLPDWFGSVLRRVEVELGIPRDSAMFFHGVRALVSLSKSNKKMKVEVFRSFGFSDREVYALVRRLPFVLGSSEAKICSMLNFYCNELGYATEYIASRPVILMLSLEKRVKPRNQVLNILRKNNLVNCVLCTVLVMNEKKFVERFVLRYQEEIPDLFETYTNSVKSS